MRKVKLILILTLLSGIYLPIFASIGGYPGGFLEYGFGGVNLAMGKSMNLSSPFSLMNNPSVGLFNPNKLSVETGYMSLPLDRRIYGLAGNYKVGRDASIGLIWINSAVGELYERDIDGYIKGKISNSEHALLFIFSKSILDFISIGGAFKGVQANLFELNAFSMGADLGISFHLLDKSLILGASGKNLGVKYPWDSGEVYEHGVTSTEEFLQSFEISANYKKEFYLPFTVSSSFYKTEKNDGTLLAGLEITPVEYIGLRIGYNGDNVTFGTGINYSMGDYKLGFNWAMIPSPLDLEPSQLFSLGFIF